jgi:phosphohistidine phosphatase
MKNLILIRHAKASAEPHFLDVDRPINQRGVVDVSKVASDFLISCPEKFVVYCSNATRAKETAIIFCDKLLYPVENINFCKELYTFDENDLEVFIKKIPNDVDNIILFGHNMALTNFVNKFGNISIDNVPTTGLIWIQYNTNNWNQLNAGKINKTIFPRNLK